LCRSELMIKYGLPLFAAIALTFAIFKIVHTQPVHAKLTPPAAPPGAVYANQVGAVGLVEAESENIAISLPVPGLVTRVDVKAADARLDQAKAELARLKAGTWKPDLDIARAEVDEARRQVERAEADLSRLVVTAPIAGEILQCKVHPGEFAQAGPLAQPLIL